MATNYYEDVINKAGLETVKADDLQKKFDAVTEAEYNKQRTELQNTENKFYNKLYYIWNLILANQIMYLSFLR